MAADTAETSDDAVLGGRLILRQPLRGHRIGHDGILLAAATSAQAGGHAVDLGSGVGGAGLALGGVLGDVAAGAEPVRASVYESLGVQRIINATGTVTILGGSLMPPEVIAAMRAPRRGRIRPPTRS